MTTAPPSIPAPTTSVSPTLGRVWGRARGLLLAAAILALAGVIIAALRSGDQYGRLDPRSADRYGSRAAAELLADRGVDTTVATTLDEAVSAVGPDTTLLVTNPDLLNARRQAELRAATSGSGGRTVLLAPGPASLETLAPDVRAVEPTSVRPLPPSCDASYARRAGDAELGGITYTTSADDVDACYLSGELPTLLRLPDGSGDGDTVLLGAPDPLYNDRLDEHGNASLALQLLGSRPHLVWYLPSLDDATAGDGDESFFDLIPPGWKWGALQLAVAAALAALWRARRLGPLVPERLPVAVPASEATEGRARLYRQADARDRAADALRSAARARLAPLVGVPASRAHDPEGLVPAVAAHLGGDDAPHVHALLFGPAPADDDALVRLADELDLLESRITPSPRDKDHTS
ncbi:DUF4350 domain-containing protein [Streptomyces megasporus]|uniref:DUF4350 domain-containing protein n=1 Tax=Streptomyces megasporus TaxID=44060 RepID=UPI0006892347|nr:DUF4350 domain-containing protein [Streptomyces megasporus]